MENKNNDSSLVSVKSVREGEDLSGRKRVELTFGTDKRGVDGIAELVEAINERVQSGNPLRLDIRIGEQTSKQGRKFPTAFVLVKEVKPQEDVAPAQQTFQRKPSKADKIKERASKIESALE